METLDKYKALADREKMLYLEGGWRNINTATLLLLSRKYLYSIYKTHTMIKADILVCCHKKDYYYDGEGYFPIQVGKAVSTVDLGIQGDNVGDNISVKNPNYCELTGHYWYWRNRHNKYVGLCHYRRYFDFKHKVFLRNTRTIGVNEVIAQPPHLPDLENIFKKYDIILPKKKIYPASLRCDYAMCHIINDIDILEKVINEKSPEYKDAYQKIILRNNKLSHFNMFLTTWEIFDDYSKWLFMILEEVEKRVSISSYPDQARVFGYLSERMLNVYVKKKRLKVKYVPIMKISDNEPISTTEEMFGTIRNSFVSLFFILPKKIKHLLFP